MMWSCLRPPYATWLGMVLGAGTVTAMALTAGVTSATTLAAGPSTCGQTGSANGAICTYATVNVSDPTVADRKSVV